jgi:hypothetical protein
MKCTLAETWRDVPATKVVQSQGRAAIAAIACDAA